MKTKFISLAATLLLAASTTSVFADDIYLVGPFNEWGNNPNLNNSNYKFSLVEGQSDVYTLTLNSFGGNGVDNTKFKIKADNILLGVDNSTDFWMNKTIPSVSLVEKQSNSDYAASCLYLPIASKYKFTINNGELTVDGFWYIAGTFNEWQSEMMSFQDGAYSIDYQFTNGDRFKFIDNEGKWYGGDTDEHSVYYGIHNNHHSNIPLTEGNSGSDFIIERTGSYTFKVSTDNKLTVEGFPPLVSLNNDATDNEATLKDFYDNNQRTLDIVLQDRTLKKDGNWNTICLPFDASITEGPLNGAIVYRLKNTSNFSDGSLSLDFERFYGISRIKPYLIKWEKPENYNPETDDIKNPRFDNVELHAYLPNWDGNNIVKMKGSYDATTISGNQYLYLGEGNMLYWPDPSVTIGAFRAYFELGEGITAGEPLPGQQGIKSFVLNFDDDNEVTSIKQVNNAAGNANAWYTLDGRRLNEKPAAAGLYINNGKKVVIK